MGQDGIFQDVFRNLFSGNDVHRIVTVAWRGLMITGGQAKILREPRLRFDIFEYSDSLISRPKIPVNCAKFEGK
jgi:hypothetical protein